jgi:hypothetical protein
MTRAEGLAWYEQLRESYRPEALRVLLIGESPPDPGAADRRFFYAPTLSRYDNLYRGVAEALYGDTEGFSVEEKTGNLDRLRDDGFWLVDAVEHPINKTSRAERKRAIERAAGALVQHCIALAPEEGIIICHGLVHEAVAPRLRRAGLPLLHSEPIPFPLGNWRDAFVRQFREALGRAALSSGTGT